MISDEAAERIYNEYNANGEYAEAPEMVSDDIKQLLVAYSDILIKSYGKVKEGLEQEKSLIITDNNLENSAKYGCFPSEVLLNYFCRSYSKIVKKELVPTYSYTRLYKKGSPLLQHSDRPSCQYSITLNIGSDSKTPWPFYCKTKLIENSKPTKIFNNLFVPIIYNGPDVSHWRDPLEKEYSLHVFFHYVDKNDERYKPFWYDGRRYLGQQEFIRKINHYKTIDDVKP